MRSTGKLDDLFSDLVSELATAPQFHTNLKSETETYLCVIPPSLKLH